MKKLLIIFSILLFLSACTSKETVVEKKQLKIMTTIFPQYDFTREIVKDKADVKMLLKPGAESHSYEPTPQDIKQIEESDVLIYVGGENDHWVEEILKTLTKKPVTYKLIDMVQTLDEEIVEGMEDSHDHSHEEEEAHAEGRGHVHEGEIDEHVWTSIPNAISIVEKLSAIYATLDSEHATFYQDNAKDYQNRLQELDKQMQDVLAGAKRHTIVFGDRYPFRYFSENYGLEYYAAFSGCSTETEASAATVRYLIDRVNDEKIPVVFTIELSSGKIADAIVDATDAKKLELHSAHNVTKDQFEQGITYLDIMKQNIEVLKEALQ